MESIDGTWVWLGDAEVVVRIKGARRDAVPLNAGRLAEELLQRVY